MAPPKYDDIEKTAADVHSARDFDIKKLLKIKYNAKDVGAVFTSESSVDAKLDKLVGKIVAEKYKGPFGISFDKATIANDKKAGITTDIETSYAVPSVAGLKVLFDASRKPNGARAFKAGLDFGASNVLVNAKFEQSKKGTIWATYSPLADLVVGTKITTSADLGLDSAEAKASYVHSGIFAGATAAIKKATPEPLPKDAPPPAPVPDATIHVGFAHDSGLKVAAKVNILPAGAYALDLGAEYLLKGVIAQDVTLRVKGTQDGKLVGLLGLNLAKGVNLISNAEVSQGKDAYNTNFGLQLTLDA